MNKTEKSQLTIKQERFVQEYMKHGDASAAYRKAYDTKNMKPETVWRTAKALLDNPKVAARIKTLREALEKKSEITREMVLKEYARIAFVDTQNMYDETGKLKTIPQMDEDTRRAIAGVNVSDKGLNIKLADKKGALDSIAKLQGWIIDKREVKHTNPIQHSHTIVTYQSEEEAERAHRDLLKDA